MSDTGKEVTLEAVASTLMSVIEAVETLEIRVKNLESMVSSMNTISQVEPPSDLEIVQKMEADGVDWDTARSRLLEERYRG